MTSVTTAAEASAATTSRQLRIESQAEIYFLFSIDLGFLLHNGDDTWQSQRKFLATRAGGFFTPTIYSNPVNVTFGDLRDGNNERDVMIDRGKQASAKDGKFVWSSSLLLDEAPLLFRSQEPLRELAYDVDLGKQANFRMIASRVRIFPRGVLAYEQRWMLTNPPGHLSVEQFISAVRMARAQAGEDAWAQLRSTLKSLRTRDDLPIENDAWLDPDANSESFIRQHLIRHSMIFLESPPGEVVAPAVTPSFDLLPIDQKKALVGILNFTKWQKIYSRTYVNAVFHDVVRNREDEIYLTDNDCSIVVLAKYWDKADPLQYYQEDLVLATQFELSRLTHLRYLAYYLRKAPETTTALALDGGDAKAALSFVLDVQGTVLRSSYDHPAEALIQHGFTRRFLAQVATQRGTKASLDELDSYIGRIARAIELRSSLELSGKNFGVARRTLIATWIVLIITALGVIVAVALTFVPHESKVCIVEVPQGQAAQSKHLPGIHRC